MKVSIITPTFNSEKTVLRCLNSIKSQDYSNIEHIVIDGGSSDNTVKILEKNNSGFSKIISEPDDGIYDAMNKGIKLATGDIIGILNSDDEYVYDRVISELVDKFSKGADCVYGNIDFVKSNDVIRQWISGDFFKKSFFRGWHPPHPAFFVTKKVYNEIGLYRKELNIAADFEFMLRFFERYDFKIKYLNKSVVNMAYGGESTGSLKNIIKGNLQCKKAFKLNDFNPPAFYMSRRLLPKLKQIKVLNFIFKRTKNEESIN